MIQDERLMGSALALGVLTATEANMDRPKRLEAVFQRCELLELGQALVVNREFAAAFQVFQSAADCFCDPDGRCAEVVAALEASMPATAGMFLREVYTHWGKALETQLGGQEGVAAARNVYAQAVGRGVWMLPLQRPCDHYLRRLSAKPFWDASKLPAARALQAAAGTILAECKSLLASTERQFRAYHERGIDHGGADTHVMSAGGVWSDVQLYAGCRRDEAYCALCPRTAELIASFPEMNTVVYGAHWFSRLGAGTRLATHCGPSNYRLRLHLGLFVPPGARIRVGSEVRAWREGEVLCFDDSFEHEVLHDGDEDRIVLICDIWHPELDVDATILPQCSPAHLEAIEAARAGRHLPRRRGPSEAGGE